MSEKTLIGKAFNTVFDFDGKILPDVRAEKTGSTSYRLIFSGGHVEEVVVGEQINSSLLPLTNEGAPLEGSIEEAHSNALRVGRYIIIAGENLDNSLEAIKISSDTELEGVNRYLIRGGKTSVKVNVGQEYSDFGMVSEDQYGNLRLSNKNKAVLVKPKLHEINILIFDNKGPEGKGYEAYMNFIIPGDNNNHKNGVKGIFFPSFKNRPAKFCELPNEKLLKEYGLDDDQVKTFVTAAFFPAKKPGFTNGRFRSLEKALKERLTFKQVTEVRNTIRSHVKLTGIPEEEHPDTRLLKQLESQLAYLNNDSYKPGGFVITEGFGLFGSKLPDKHLRKSYNHNSNDGPNL